MLIVTPTFGSAPEPRPQALVTGDRALQLLDIQSSAALQQAGVKVATISKIAYDAIVATLTAEVFPGLDPDTGKLADIVLPDRLSSSAIASLDVLGPDDKIEDEHIPTYLTPSGLMETIAASSAVQFTTDHDGTPVVLGLEPVGLNTQAVTGTLQGGAVVGGTVHGDLVTATLAQFTTTEQAMSLYDNQGVTPGAPAVDQVKVYSQPSSRLVYTDHPGTVYIVGNKRIVTDLPDAGSSQLGDEVLISASGEHRIYKGSTLGWRLASPLQVPDVATRNGLGSKYAGMTVYVESAGQEHVWRADNMWHGTVNTFFTGGAAQLSNQVNDTNFRVWNLTNFADPGVPWRLLGRLRMEVVQLNVFNRVEVWISVGDYLSGNNPHTFDLAYNEPPNSWSHFSLNPRTDFDITGAKSVIITWRCTRNYANAYSGNYQSFNDWMMVPV